MVKQVKKFNCSIYIRQGDKTNLYQFDDYRIATAIENLLLNMDSVQHIFDCGSAIKLIAEMKSLKDNVSRETFIKKGEQ